MQVDEARSNDQTARVEFFVRAATGFIGWGDLGDVAIAQQDVHGRIDPGGGIHEATAFDQKRSCFVLRHEVIRADPCKSVAYFAFPIALARIAMRTGTPFATS